MTTACQACRAIYCDRVCECRCHAGPYGAPRGANLDGPQR